MKLRLLASLCVLLLATAGCNTTQPKPDFQTAQPKKIKIVESDFLDRLIDSRPAEQKRTRSQKVGEKTIQYIGDEAFSSSPLNAIANEVSHWLRRNPDAVIEIHSLTMYFGDELEAIRPEYEAAPFHYGGVLDMIVMDIIFNASRSNYREGGHGVVVAMKASVNEQTFDIHIIEHPVPDQPPLQWVAEALGSAGHDLKLKLLALPAPN